MEGHGVIRRVNYLPKWAKVLFPPGKSPQGELFRAGCGPTRGQAQGWRALFYIGGFKLVHKYDLGLSVVHPSGSNLCPPLAPMSLREPS